MAQKHIEQVLTTAGLTAEQIKALNEIKDDAADFKLDDYVAPIITGAETRLKNDAKFYETLNETNLPKEFMKKLEAAQYGRSAAEVRQNIIKNLALDPKDFEGDEFKPMEKFLTAVQAKITTGKVTDKELQAKLVEANNRIATMEAELPNLEKKHQDAAQARIDGAHFDMQVMAQLAAIPGLKVNATLLSPQFVGALKAKYGFELVNGIVELRQKDKPTLKPMSADGKKELSLKDAIEGLAKDFDVVDPDWNKKRKTEKQDGHTTIDVEGKKGGFKMSSHVQSKIEKKIEDEKVG